MGPQSWDTWGPGAARGRTGPPPEDPGAGALAMEATQGLPWEATLRWPVPGAVGTAGWVGGASNCGRYTHNAADDAVLP